MSKPQPIPAGPDDHPLVALCKSKGNDASDLRDAAHEIYHARTAGTRSWDRDVVHRALMRVIPIRSFLWIHELHARAIEQLVCQHFGVECESLEHWIHISIMEAIKFRLPYAEMDISLPHATDFLMSPRVIREAQAIIALAEPKKRRKSKRS